MKKKKKQIAVITAERGSDFEREVNERLEQVAGCEPDIIFKMDTDCHIAYITWEETVEALETAADRYNAMGIKLKCGQCPYRERPKDKRVRYTSCTLGDRQGIAYGDPACDRLYEMLEKGEVQL